MPSSSREAFYACLKELLAPALRDLGFKGSGQHFLRTSGETLNAINIQGSKYGEGCFVNLGLHFSFLPPCWAEAVDPLRKWKEIDCEFRWRLESEPGHDKLWEYGTRPHKVYEQVQNLIETYANQGEVEFQRFSTCGAVAEAISFERLSGRRLEGLKWTTTEVRYALALARIHAYLGNCAESARFARFGLENLGGATLLKAPLQQLASAA